MKRFSSGLKNGAAIAFIICGAASVAQAQQGTADPPEPASIQGHLARAMQIANGHPYATLLASQGYSCDSPSTSNNVQQAVPKRAVPPEKIFDNLYYLGMAEKGSFILKTSDGLIMWDTLDTTDEAKNILVPGMQQLGLDPKDIKLIIITHGHFDHFGGAKYMHDTYNIPIAASEVDWALMAQSHGQDAQHPVPPVKERVLADGQKITVGDATIQIVLTPGHTQGTVSTIVPVKDNGVTRNMAMWGGTAVGNAAFKDMGNSMEKFKNIAAAANVEGILDNHPQFLYMRSILSTRKPGQPNPLVIGAPDVQATFGVMRECLGGMEDWAKAVKTQ